MIRELVVAIDIIVEPDDDEYHAYCPALKGLHTSGKTEQEAKAANISCSECNVDLQKRLVSRQTQLHLTDVEFSRGIGVSYAYWNLIRNGKLRIGRSLKALRGALRQYPELAPYVLLELMRDDDDGEKREG